MITIKHTTLQEAAEKGMDEFLQAITDSIYEAIGGALTAETMAKLNSDQITLLAYIILRDAVMDGGFVDSSTTATDPLSISIRLPKPCATGACMISTR